MWEVSCNESIDFESIIKFIMAIVFELTEYVHCTKQIIVTSTSSVRSKCLYKLKENIIGNINILVYKMFNISKY